MTNPGNTAAKDPGPGLILASGSRYRRDMLERLGIPFSVISADIDESPNPDETGEALALRLAESKARKVADQQPGHWVIGADQVAECDGQLLGKPGTVSRAVEQLEATAGREIVFHSAIALIRDNRTETCCIPTRVRLRPLSRARIEEYVARDRPLDCAGAMKSEQLGIVLAESMTSDDPTALIGLPLIALTELLERFGLSPFQAP